MRIAIVDSYYPDFIKTLPLIKGQRSYQQELDFTLAQLFGTHSGYGRALRMLNHEVIDIIGNYAGLQNLWAIENGFPDSCGYPQAIAISQIKQFKPDVVLCQDLSFFDADWCAYLREKYVLAAQCSCAIREDMVKHFDVIFTSIPSHVATLEKLGTRAVFLPLAFDPIVLESVPVAPQRTHVSFVGGYGWQWNMDELFITLAERTPIQFWGYGFEKAPMVVRNKWHGPAFGKAMYEIYLRSLIVVNRHGGISQGMANNLRLFEATGCGAVLLTEMAPNIGDYFTSGEYLDYDSPKHCAGVINMALEHPETLSEVASAGQARTLAQHTYFQRMPIVSKVLTECLERKKVSA